MGEPTPRHLMIGGETFLVGLLGPFAHRGETLWLAKTVIAWDPDDRIVPGDAHLGSPRYRFAGFKGVGPTADDAFRDLEENLAEMKAHEGRGAGPGDGGFPAAGGRI
jgi:hypothetical protein